MRLKIRHNTQYTYERPVTYGLQQLRLTPKNDHNQRVLDWTITIEGGQKELAFQDHNANHVDLIGFSATATRFRSCARARLRSPTQAAWSANTQAPRPAGTFNSPPT